MEHFYSILQNQTKSKIYPPKSLEVKAEIIKRLNTIDQVILGALITNLKSNIYSGTQPHDIYSELVCDIDITKHEKSIKEYLWCNRRTILKRLNSIKCQNTFMALCNDIKKNAKTTSKKVAPIINATTRLDSLNLAKTIVKISGITELRPNKIQFSYKDNTESICLECPSPLKIHNLLPPKRQCNEKINVTLKVKRAQLTGAGEIKLLHENETIKHEILDVGFLANWKAGKIPLHYDDRIEATVEIEAQLDGCIYKIISINKIISSDGHVQMSFDF